MKLMTNKKYCVVFGAGQYWWGSCSYYERKAWNARTPILFTDCRDLAIATSRKLNKTVMIRA